MDGYSEMLVLEAEVTRKTGDLADVVDAYLCGLATREELRERLTAYYAAVHALCPPVEKAWAS